MERLPTRVSTGSVETLQDPLASTLPSSSLSFPTNRKGSPVTEFRAKLRLRRVW